jgi:HK97 family phage major capsid protein/HK97 family phage prohead protease
MTVTHRAYSFLEIKAVDEERRIIRGVATTPGMDRVGDIVEPLGVSFKNPLKLLWQHDSDKPVGLVKFDTPTKDGVTFTAELPVVAEEGALRQRIEEAWQSVKYNLINAVSIGFRALEYAFMDEGGIRFIKTEVYELSLVTIPANASALITSVGKNLDANVIAVLKRFDTNAPAPSGQLQRSAKHPRPVSGKTFNLNSRPEEGLTAMNDVGAQIAALKEQRKEKAVALEAIQKAATEAKRTKTKEEREQFDDLRDELRTLDAEIADLEDIEGLYKPTVKAVSPTTDPAPRPRVPATAEKKLDKGIAFAQLIKVKAVARLEGERKLDVAERMYGRDSVVVGILKAGEQTPGSTVSGTWGYDLISQEGAAAADFAEYLRPSTILGKFGQGNVPALRSVPFRKPLILQTGGAVGNWVGEAKPKPVDELNFDRSVLAPLKCATIVVLTEENVRDSSPSSDMIVRDDLRNALAQLEDEAFITPTNAGSAGIKPEGILYTAGADHAIASESYSDETDVILDIRSLMQRYINANNPAGQAVLIMEEGVALAAGLILNALGQRAFPGLGMRGGELQGIPVITSENVPSGIVSVVNASDVLRADDGEVTVDMSREASVEMKDSGNITQNGAAGTGASLVSLWQNNLVGIRAEHTINWKRRRPVIGAYLTGVAWGGAVNVS